MTLSPSVAKILKEEEDEISEENEDETAEERELREAEERGERDTSLTELAEEELTGQEQEMGQRVGDAELTPTDERQIRRVQEFGKQVTFLDDEMVARKKQGANYVITARTKGRGKQYSKGASTEQSLFPFISGEKNLEEFLVFLNSCLSMRVDERIPSDYFTRNIMEFIQEDNEEAQELKFELEKICAEAKELAEKKFANGDMNGYETVRLAFEKIHGRKFLTSRGKKRKAQALNLILDFLKTGKTPRIDVDKTKAMLTQMASEISEKEADIESLKERTGERMKAENYAAELKAKLQAEAAGYIGKPSEEIKAYMEGLSEDLRAEVLEMYEETVVPQIEKEIEEMKAGKRGSLREATTARMADEIERLQENIASQEAELKNLGKNKREELEKEISDAKEKLEAWRSKNFKRDDAGKLLATPKQKETYQRMQDKLDKLITQNNNRLSELTQSLGKERSRLEESIKDYRQRLTKKKIAFSQRTKIGSKKVELAGSIQELKDMLNPEYYNDQHIRLLRSKLMQKYIEEEMEDYFAEKQKQYKSSEEELRKELLKYRRVDADIKNLRSMVPTIEKIIKEIDEMNVERRKGSSVRPPTREEEEDESKDVVRPDIQDMRNIRQLVQDRRKVLRLFVGAGQYVSDIVKNTKALLAYYEDLDEFITESLQMLTDAQEGVNDETMQDELDEGFEEAHNNKKKVMDAIVGDLDALFNKVAELEEAIAPFKESE